MTRTDGDRPDANRIDGRTVLVTGATAGIGEACARRFAEEGARVILLGRRVERLEALADELRDIHDAETRIASLDVRDREAIERLRDELAAEGFTPDVIVNNAGKARGLDPVHEGDPDDWDEMIDTNLKGLLWVTRAFLPAMVEADRGHVVNIGSSAGHWTYPKGNVYAATKFGVKALTEGINIDLLGTRVRVSSVDPGLVETEFSEVRFHGDSERARTVYEGYEPLRAEDVADAVAYVVNAPEHVDVFNLVLLPTDQRHSMLVHRDDA
ncbi:MAG TPA: SDR family NAD(P)-dependent oxidoreductase [Longimicrobiales bacterium]|nr:SDR family NAD(P)-dependent oxidoreductase [Longimicrobiales bacterium]